MISSPLESGLECLAVITTVLQYLSGTIVCQKYVKKKSTGDSSGLPFVCGFLSSSLWLCYGLLTKESIVVLVNVVGAGLMLVYTGIYYIFTVNKRIFIRQLAVVLSVLITLLVFITYEKDHDYVVRVLGYTCCLVTVIFFAAPFASLVHVMKTKNAESLPFPLISMSLFVSVQWLIYGIIIKDMFIQLPNFLGCLLSLLQLSLFVCYPPRSFSGPGYKLVDQTIDF